MGFGARFFDNPLGCFAGILVWIPIAIWVVSMIHWMVLGEIDAGHGIVSILLAVTLGFFTSNPPIPEMAPVFFLLVLATVVVFPYLRSAFRRHELAMIDVESMEGAYEALVQKPDNDGALLRIATIAYSRALPGHAVRIAERALANLPAQHYKSETAMVADWKRKITDPEHFRPVPCQSCGKMVNPGEIVCAGCGSRFLIDYARGAWVSVELAKKLLASWMALILIAVGIPSAVRWLPPGFAVFVILCLLLGGAWIALQAFRSTLPRKAS